MKIHEQYTEDNNEMNHLHYRRRCDDCGVEISKRRLIANPKSTRCIYCQEDLEEKLDFLSMIKKTWNEEEFSVWEEQWND